MLSAVHKFKAINIIHVTFSFLPVIGGAEIMVHNVAKAQKSQGNEVFVLTSWNNWRNNKYDLPYKVLPLLPKTISITKYFNQHNINVNWLLGIQLLAYVFIKKIDVCHLNYAYMEGYAFSRLLKQFKIPTILTSHGGDIQYDRVLNYGMRLDQNIDRKIVKSINNYTMLTAVSESIEDEYIKLGVSKDKIELIPNGCDIAMFNTDVDVPLIKKKYGIDDKSSIILTIGRNAPTKGFGIIPTVLEKLILLNENIVWIVAGKDVETIRNDLALKTKGHLILINPSLDDNNLSINIPSTEIIDLYRIANVFVFPSKIESFGMVLIEAMASKLPIVTTDAPGCRDVVSNNINGLISPVDDLDKMTNNIIALLTNGDQASRIRKNQSKILSKYSWSNIASQYLDVYRRAILKSRGSNV